MTSRNFWQFLAHLPPTSRVLLVRPSTVITKSSPQHSDVIYDRPPKSLLILTMKIILTWTRALETQRRASRSFCRSPWPCSGTRPSHRAPSWGRSPRGLWNRVAKCRQPFCSLDWHSASNWNSKISDRIRRIYRRQYTGRIVRKTRPPSFWFVIVPYSVYT